PNTFALLSPAINLYNAHWCGSLTVAAVRPRKWIFSEKHPRKPSLHPRPLRAFELSRQPSETPPSEAPQSEAPKLDHVHSTAQTEASAVNAPASFPTSPTSPVWSRQPPPK